MEIKANLTLFIIWGSAAMFIMVLTIILFVLKYQKGLLKKDIEFSKQERDYEKNIFNAIIVAEERQKNVISRNLHDAVFPNLSGVQQAVSQIRNSQEPSIYYLEQLIQIENYTDIIAAEIRAACYDLVPETLQRLGLIKGFENLLYTARQAYKVQTSFELISTGKLSVTAEIQSNLYRILQEVLANILKHSGSTRIKFIVKVQSNLILIDVSYNGNGINENEVIALSENGLGLKSIQARLRLIGGTIKYLRKKNESMSIIQVPQSL